MIGAAYSYNAKAYDAVRTGFRRGMTEKDIEELIRCACGVDFEGDIVSGPRSAAIEGKATERVLCEGDVLILDLQFFYDGVWSDTTRSFVIGEPSAEQAEVYETLLRAQCAGQKALFSGNSARRVYAAVRAALSPFEAHFPHHAGHLVGAEAVEQPQFLPEREELLPDGTVGAIEPGLYFEGSFGMRLENNYRITKSGGINLFPYTMDFKDFIL